jgi:hypothetical protein
MSYNKHTKKIDDEVELPERGWAKRIVNNLIWGNPQGNSQAEAGVDEPDIKEPDDFTGTELDDRDR